MLPHMPRKSLVESMTIGLMPASSVKTRSVAACSRTHAPNVGLPVKSMVAMAGSVTKSFVAGASASSAASSSTFGSKPASFMTSRAILMVMASGRMAPGCGLTMTLLPVARLANSAG